MRYSIFEIFLGFVVLTAAGVFAFFAVTQTGLTVSTDTYQLVARFGSVGGVGPGTDVKISGVSIGQVVRQELDTETFEGKLVIQVPRSLDLAIDSSASIVASSLLGGNHLVIEPGVDSVKLKQGDEFSLTSSAPNLMDLIAGAVFGGVRAGGSASSSDRAGGAPSPDGGLLESDALEGLDDPTFEDANGGDAL